jgi:hypothetical protein
MGPDRFSGGVGEVGRQRNKRIEVYQYPPDSRTRLAIYFNDSR